MLRIEKKSGKRGARIVIGERSLFFTADLLLAFALALAIHIAGISALYIRTLRVDYGQAFLPAKVSADLSGQARFTVAGIDEKRLNPLLELMDPAPRLFNGRGGDPERFPAYFHNLNTWEVLGGLLPLKDGCADFLDPPLSSKKRVRVELSGELAGTKFRSGFKMDRKLLRGIVTKAVRALFAISVETESGTLLRREVKEAIDDDRLQSLAERIVDNLKFETENGEFVKSGLVEVVFAAL